ncbi:MAG: pantetheine-phosphate adenylyltransferase [Sphaerochaetaceae bacterium]|nr:pantetheine-phosphate adenylyltransferase [Sphaerochaetaceae bacterium]
MMNPRIAMFPGSFDPPTLGHMDIIKRSALLYDKLYVVVADNISKKNLFTASERVEMLKAELEEFPSVEVVKYPGLMVEFAQNNDVGVMIRGVRAMGDFTYEFELAMMNRQICPGLEVLFMPTDAKYFLIRSSQIKELATFGADISNMVSDRVANLVTQKLKKRD